MTFEPDTCGGALIWHQEAVFHRAIVDASPRTGAP